MLEGIGQIIPVPVFLITYSEDCILASFLISINIFCTKGVTGLNYVGSIECG
jgi:hypothetical protein